MIQVDAETLKKGKINKYCDVNYYLTDGFKIGMYKK